MRIPHFLLSTSLLAASCSSHSAAYYLPDNGNTTLIVKDGKTLQDRFKLPEGYKRMATNGFGNFLRNLALKPHGSSVLYYNGNKKYKNVHAAVIDMEIGNTNLQQCADAVMRLRAEYLYNTKQYDKIHFHFTNGFNAAYSKWTQGYRVQVKGNNAVWIKAANPATDYKGFRQYMDVVFSYAGTLSLSKELKRGDIIDIQPGDVFIKGGSPGHAVIVLDVAQNNKGHKLFMIAQSYMPAQEIEILINPNNTALYTWYEVDTHNPDIITPEYDFTIYDLKRFAD